MQPHLENMPFPPATNFTMAAPTDAQCIKIRIDDLNLNAGEIQVGLGQLAESIVDNFSDDECTVLRMRLLGVVHRLGLPKADGVFEPVIG